MRGKDLQPQQHPEHDQDMSTYDYNGAYEPYIEPTTGTRHMLPKAIIVRLNESYTTQQGPATAAPAAAAAATGFFEHMISCFTPMFGGRLPLQDKSNDSQIKPSIAERLEQVADLNITKELQPSNQHQSGQAVPVTATGIKAVPTAVIENNKTGLVPGTVKNWSKWSLPLLLVNVPNFKMYYSCSPEVFNDLCTKLPRLQEENEAIAGTLTAALDNTSTHVTNFKNELIKMDCDASSSGYKLLHAILSSEECGRGIYRMSQVNDFEAKSFFNDVSTVEDVIAASDTMLAEYQLLPESERSEQNAEIKMLLKKMPLSIESEVAEYKKKIKKKEAYDLPLKWTYKQLAMMLAVDIISAKIDTSGTINAAKSTKRVCLNCGSPDHLVTEKDAKGKRLCTKQCPECKSTICPGVRGGVCVVHAETMPERKSIKNTEGWPVPEHVYKWLEELRETERTKLDLDQKPTANMATMTNNQASMGFAMF